MCGGAFEKSVRSNQSFFISRHEVLTKEHLQPVECIPSLNHAQITTIVGMEELGIHSFSSKRLYVFSRM